MTTATATSRARPVAPGPSLVALAAATPGPRRRAPRAPTGSRPTRSLYLEVARPADLLDRLDRRARPGPPRRRSRLSRSTSTSDDYRELRGGGRAVAGRLGTTWDKALRDLIGGGLVARRRARDAAPGDPDRHPARPGLPDPGPGDAARAWPATTPPPRGSPTRSSRPSTGGSRATPLGEGRATRSSTGRWSSPTRPRRSRRSSTARSTGPRRRGPSPTTRLAGPAHGPLGGDAVGLGPASGSTGSGSSTRRP